MGTWMVATTGMSKHMAIGTYTVKKSDYSTSPYCGWDGWRLHSVVTHIGCAKGDPEWLAAVATYMLYIYVYSSMLVFSSIDIHVVHLCVFQYAKLVFRACLLAQ